MELWVSLILEYTDSIKTEEMLNAYQSERLCKKWLYQQAIFEKISVCKNASFICVEEVAGFYPYWKVQLWAPSLTKDQLIRMYFLRIFITIFRTAILEHFLAVTSEASNFTKELFKMK